MQNKKFTRRQAILTGSAGMIAAATNFSFIPIHLNTSKQLALLGGEKVRKVSWPSWPVWDNSAEEEVIKMLRSGRWYRGRGEYVTEFEEKYARLMGVSHCLATASGTTALLVALQILGVDAGD